MKLVCNIGVDCMGFENSPLEAVKAVCRFSKKHRDVGFTLFGDPKYFQRISAKKYPFLKFVPTQSVIEQNDTVISARQKMDSSMMLGIDYLKNGQVDGLLSAGSSSIFVAYLYTKIGMLAKLSKPAFMPFIPTLHAKGINLLDVGANISQSAQDIYNLALMGSVYANKVRGLANPRVGVVNIGTESYKGPTVLQEANKLIKADTRINYCGFIEPRDFFFETVDVAVSDGYAGNLVLKTAEGALKMVGKLLKSSLIYNPWTLLFSPALFIKILKTFDYKNNAGAIVMGLKRLAVKTHGSADEKQFYSTINLTCLSLKNKLINWLEKDFA